MKSYIFLPSILIIPTNENKKPSFHTEECQNFYYHNKMSSLKGILSYDVKRLQFENVNIL
jgi:hypothetical protein